MPQPGATQTVERAEFQRGKRGPWGDALRRLIRNRLAMIGLVCIVLFIVAAITAPLIAPFGPLDGSLSIRLQPPSSVHLMGTDLQGRDELSRVLYGAQVSLQVGTVAVVLALTMGMLVGALAGGIGGRVDSIFMRATDVMLAIPGILLAIGVVAYLGRGLLQLMFAIAITYVPIFARLLRGSLLALRDADYVVAARSIGGSDVRVLLRHMLPNALTPLIVQAALVLATAIIDIAGLGFLGLGPPDPRTAEWGTMLADAKGMITTAPWLLFFPGLAIVLSAIGFTLLGDGLREALDPHLRR